MILLKMCLISMMGISECILDKSREANLNVGSIGVSLKACISCVVFFILCVCMVGELHG